MLGIFSFQKSRPESAGKSLKTGTNLPVIKGNTHTCAISVMIIFNQTLPITTKPLKISSQAMKDWETPASRHGFFLAN
jgi:hypothetical protein